MDYIAAIPETVTDAETDGKTADKWESVNKAEYDAGGGFTVSKEKNFIKREV